MSSCLAPPPFVEFLGALQSVLVFLKNTELLKSILPNKGSCCYLEGAVIRPRVPLGPKTQHQLRVSAFQMALDELILYSEIKRQL